MRTLFRSVLIDHMVACGACVVVATGTAMGVAVGLVVLIPVGYSWVPIGAGGTAISVVGAAVAATVGAADVSFKQRYPCLDGCEGGEGLVHLLEDGGVICCHVGHCDPVVGACLREGGECL